MPKYSNLLEPSQMDELDAQMKLMASSIQTQQECLQFQILLLLDLIDVELKESIYIPGPTNTTSYYRIDKAARLSIARKDLLKQKMESMAPPSFRKDSDVSSYAWKLYSDHLDEKTIYFDVTDPEKKRDKEKYKHFLYKLPLKADPLYQQRAATQLL
jgi:hypothetical protein